MNSDRAGVDDAASILQLTMQYGLPQGKKISDGRHVYWRSDESFSEVEMFKGRYMIR